MMTTAADPALARIVESIQERKRFVIVSHARPDGDAIGSALAMAYALRVLGKQARVVSKDPAPEPLQMFPGVEEIEITDHVDDPGDAVIVMECGDLTRPAIAGLETGFVINIDHHVGNTGYGNLCWFDERAAACGEMVFDLVGALGVTLTVEIAVHLYVAIVTDTGSFHFSNISARTFDICRQCIEAGVDPQAVARRLFDSNSMGRLRLFGAVLNDMELDPTDQVATLVVDDALLTRCGATLDDMDGLINQPLTVKNLVAVIMFKSAGPDGWRVSMRSKGAVNVNTVAAGFGGGGHVNASGCSAAGTLSTLKPLFLQRVSDAIARAV
jgi:phosphoesterase RecJ-like protein